jgi:phosphate transport system substrate-binding protein
MDNILKPVKAPFEKGTGIKLNLVLGSATLSFKNLYNNEIDASTAGTSFDGLMASLKKEGFEVKDPTEFQSVTIGKGIIYVIVNKDNPVANLSREQLKGIFTGKITNWKEVGGKDAPIIVVLSQINPATNGSFKSIVLDGEPFAKDVLEAGAFEDVRDNVASNPEAVAFGPFSIVSDSVRTPQIPEISRDFILITKGKPSPNVQKFVQFVKGEGQKYTIK